MGRREAFRNEREEWQVVAGNRVAWTCTESLHAEAWMRRIASCRELSGCHGSQIPESRHLQMAPNKVPGHSAAYGTVTLLHCRFFSVLSMEH